MAVAARSAARLACRGHCPYFPALVPCTTMRGRTPFASEKQARHRIHSRYGFPGWGAECFRGAIRSGRAVGRRPARPLGSVQQRHRPEPGCKLLKLLVPENTPWCSSGTWSSVGLPTSICRHGTFSGIGRPQESEDSGLVVPVREFRVSRLLGSSILVLLIVRWWEAPACSHR